MGCYNNSRLETHEKCPRKYQIMYLFRLVTKKSAVPLVTGTAVHAGLAAWYASGDKELAYRAFEKSYAQEVGPEDRYMEAEWEEFSEQCTYGRKLLAAYFDRYKEEPFEVLGIESAFRVPIGESCYECGKEYHFDSLRQEFTAKTLNYPILKCSCGAEIHILIGRIDLLVGIAKKVEIWDHKTTKQAGGNYMGQFSMSAQVTSYWYGATKALGMAISGFTANVLKKLKGLDPEKTFKREDFTRPKEEFPIFVQDRLATIQDIQRDTLRQYFPKRTSECYRFGTCPYVDLCKDPVPAGSWSEELTVSYEKRSADYVNEFEEFIREEENR